MLTATPRGRVSTLVDYLYMIPWILDQCNYFFELFMNILLKTWVITDSAYFMTFTTENIS